MKTGIIVSIVAIGVLLTAGLTWAHQATIPERPRCPLSAQWSKLPGRLVGLFDEATL